MAGKGAAKRNAKRRAQLKYQGKKDARKAARSYQRFVASMPKITEEHLLNFQIKHFGDDSRPKRWFVPAEEALNFKIFDEDDGLGYYPDGVKRTLTDEQIAIFRRRELWQMQRGQQLEKQARQDLEDHEQHRAASPASESSLEDELLAYAAAHPKQDSTPPVSAAPPAGPPRSNREPSQAASSDAARKRKRYDEVPYDQRHKRKWEKHIQDYDPDQGSMTHRRLVRELDDQQAESVDMDY